LANTTKNTLSVLEALGRREIPVYPGSSKPFCREAVHAEAIHGSSGLDGTTTLPEPVRTIPEITGDDVALKAMYAALSSTPPGTSWVVSTGALTNIALLFAIYPSLIEHIAGLSIMGGAVGGFFTHAPMGRLQERVELGEGLHKVLEGSQDDGEVDMKDVVKKLREGGLLKDAENMNDEKVTLLLNQARQSFGNTTPFAEFNVCPFKPNIPVYLY
jgi:uridine nucleosidase